MLELSSHVAFKMEKKMGQKRTELMKKGEVEHYVSTTHRNVLSSCESICWTIMFNHLTEMPHTKEGETKLGHLFLDVMCVF